ncbi:MAG: rhodanese-like domain-containing protein [Bacteroidetes bacterium]|nr:rhodanese-like domain-containing protein [Bacteroidota bacterium]
MNYIMLNRVAVILVLLVSIFACTEGNAQGKQMNITVEQFQERFQNNKEILIVDVRTNEEIMRGKIANAVELDYYNPEFEKNLKNLDTNKTIVVYCARGGRSLKASELFIKNGFKEVYNLEGGYTRFIEVVGK